MRKAPIFCGFFVSLALAGTASASTELPALFDARAIGMAGAVSAAATNASAIYANPALLDQVKTMSATLDFTPNRPVLTVPLGKPDSAVESDSSFFPLFFAGGAYRVHERVVVGAAVYPTAGVGASFDQNGSTMESAVAMFEANVPVSFRVNEDLSVAVAWRGTYLLQIVSIGQSAATPQLFRAQRSEPSQT